MYLLQKVLKACVFIILIFFWWKFMLYIFHVSRSSMNVNVACATFKLIWNVSEMQVKIFCLIYFVSNGTRAYVWYQTFGVMLLWMCSQSLWLSFIYIFVACNTCFEVMIIFVMHHKETIATDSIADKVCVVIGNI